MELVIPLAELRPEISRMWLRDEKMQQLIGWTIVIVYSSATVYGFSRDAYPSWYVVKLVMALSLLVAAGVLAFVTRRFEHAVIYYRAGNVALAIGRRGPEASQLGTFVDEVARQTQLVVAAQRSNESDAG